MGGHVCVCVCLSMPHTCCTCIAFAKYADSNKNNCQQCGLDTHNGRRRQWQQTATATVMPTAMPTAATAQFLLSHFTTLALSHAFCLILHCSFNIASVAVAARSRRFIAIMLQLARNALACLRERERERGREACVRVHCLHFKLNSFKFQFLPVSAYVCVRACVCVGIFVRVVHLLFFFPLFLVVFPTAAAFFNYDWAAFVVRFVVLLWLSSFVSSLRFSPHTHTLQSILLVFFFCGFTKNNKNNPTVQSNNNNTDLMYIHMYVCNTYNICRVHAKNL